MKPTRTVVLALVLILVGCAGPAPSPRPTPSTTPLAATQTASQEPAVAMATVAPLPSAPPPSDGPEPRSLPRSASTEFGGVRLTLSVDLNPLDAHYGGEALVTIENNSRRTLEWGVDGCDINAWVDAKTIATWRDSAIDLPEPLARHRDELRRIIRTDQPIRLGFRRPIFVLHRNIGCSDLAIPRELRPGRSVTQSFTWDGSAYGRLGPAPNGPVTITSRFERWKLAGGDELRPLEAKLESWVLDGRREDFLSPFEAIDAALMDDRFTSWLLTRPAETNANPVVEFDRDIGAWVIGLLTYPEGSVFQILHAAYLDPYTGEVFAVKESRLTS